MQLLAEHKTLGTVRDLKMNSILIRDVSSHNLVAKKSSNASLLMMNPVASGDNVTTGLNSAHKIKEEVPPLVPCCEGRELQNILDIKSLINGSGMQGSNILTEGFRDHLLINEDLVRSGLSAISVKHDGVVQCLSMSCACEKMQMPPGLVKHRNSFRCLHRPDLKRVPYLRRMTPDELESLFRGYADIPALSIAKDNRDTVNKVLISSKENTGTRDTIDNKIITNRDDVASVLKPIPETRSGAEDVPAGMRLHGARARLYTSVLAGAKAGDQKDSPTSEEYDAIIPDEVLPEDEVQLNEELQIILPPRCEDIESPITTDSVAC